MRFNGKYINLRFMADTYDLDHGYLSRIFNNKRVPSVSYARIIAKALHMQYDDFIEAMGLEEATITVGRMRTQGLRKKNIA